MEYGAGSGLGRLEKSGALKNSKKKRKPKKEKPKSGK
jgi:hypothetical protein